jgi:hypothetical protein
MLICVLLGIRLPLFDEPNASPFQIFKRVFGLPREWQMPPGIFDVFPRMHAGVIHALSTATPDELERAMAACRLLSRLLDDPQNWGRGAVAIKGAPLPWETIKFASLIWPSPVVRAGTVGLIILAMRSLRSALGERAAAAFASIVSETSNLWPEST